jgi:hypothetical protein
MVRFLRMAFMAGGLTLFLQLIPVTDLGAFTIIEKKIVQDGPYAFKMEVQVYGRGNFKKGPVRMTSLKVKIKNEKASPEILKVKTIRVYPEPKIHTDVETLGYSISHGKWVTKFYRLPKEKQPILSDNGYVEISFENFAIQFNPRERKFQGPLR